MLQPLGVDEQPLPTRHADSGHSDALVQELAPLHVTSHEQLPAHFILLHEPSPLHTTSQSPVGQMTSSRHANSPVQRTSHDDAFSQRIFFVQELSPQITRHGRFAGHVMSIAHSPAPEQSITHTPSTHVPFEQPCWQS